MPALRTIVRGAGSLGAALNDLVFPDHCLLTGQPLTGPQPLPMISQEGLDACDPAPTSLELMLTAQRHHYADDLCLTSMLALYAVGTDHGIDAAIYAIKYRGHQRLAVACGALLARALETLRPDALVPVPIHKARRRERGYNQAELICRGLSNATGIPVRDALMRTANTVSQTSLSDAERSTNVRTVFALSPEVDVKGQRLLLVDDVFTTGSTMNACAEVLLAAGARRVDAIAIGATA